MKRPRLTPAKATLVMLGVGTMALMGIPGVGAYVPPGGALGGTVRGADGRVLEGVTLALFNGPSHALIEMSRTDDHGRFAFQRAPESFHIFARPAPDSGHVGRWLLDREVLAGAEFDLVLERGRRVEVEVKDPAGNPVAGAEVRAYVLAPQPAVVSRLLTDAEGKALLVAPAELHLAVLADDTGWLSAWRFHQTVPKNGGSFEIQLDRAVAVEGHVKKDQDDRPLDDIVVSSWREKGGDWQWSGFQNTDVWGAFRVNTAASGPSTLRFLDPGQRFLPEQRLHEPGAALETVRMRVGYPLEIECTSAENEPRPSRVWIFSEDSNTWGFGARTDAAGRLRTTVSEVHSIVADPLHDEGLPAEAWDRVYSTEFTRLLAPGN